MASTALPQGKAVADHLDAPAIATANMLARRTLRGRHVPAPVPAAALRLGVHPMWRRPHDGHRAHRSRSGSCRSVDAVDRVTEAGATGNQHKGVSQVVGGGAGADGGAGPGSVRGDGHVHIGVRPTQNPRFAAISAARASLDATKLFSAMSSPNSFP